MKNKIHILTLLLLIPIHTSIAQSMGWVVDEQHIWRVKIADTPASQARGLMFTPYLPPNSGMLFIFNPAQSVSFWMKNTWLNLDMRFYDNNGTLVTRYPNAQPCRSKNCPLYPSNAVIKYVLEIPAAQKKDSQVSDLRRLLHDNHHINFHLEHIFPFIPRDWYPRPENILV